MYELAQYIVKIIIIAAAFLVAVIVSLRVWRAELDLRELLNPGRMLQRSVDASIDWLPKRELDAIYQTGKIVARVSSIKIDKGNHKILFEEIYNSQTLNLEAEFEFQKWRLKFLGAESITSLDTSQPHKGQIITQAVCDLLGARKTF
jgi:hypothetical protein